MLVPVLDPFDGPCELARQEWNEQVLGIDMPFHTEAAADIKCNAAHARFRHAERCRNFAPYPVHDLRR